MRVDHTSTDSLFSEALVSLAGDWRARRAVGVESVEWAWIARHASVKNPSLSGNVMSSLLQRASDGLLQEVFHHHGAPRVGKLDVAAVYARDRVVALDRCAPSKFVCDECYEPATLCCTVCSFALCPECCAPDAPAPPTHVCEPRLLGICSAFSTNASAFVDYMHDFSGCYKTNSAVIRTPERLRANLDLFLKIEAQRAWIVDADADRDVARAKIARGTAAHEAWLDRVYAVDKFA